MSAALPRILRRAGQPIFRAREDVRQTLVAVVDLCGHVDSSPRSSSSSSTDPMNAFLRKMVRRDARLVHEVLEEVSSSTSSSQTHAWRQWGRIARTLAACYNPATVETLMPLWAHVEQHTQHLLRGAPSTPLQDVQPLLLALATSRNYSPNVLKPVVEAYLEQHLQMLESNNTQGAGDDTSITDNNNNIRDNSILLLLSIVCGFDELSHSAFAIRLHERVAAWVPTLSVATIGHICALHNRHLPTSVEDPSSSLGEMEGATSSSSPAPGMNARHTHDVALLRAIQGCADRVAEEADLFTVIQTMVYLCTRLQMAEHRAAGRQAPPSTDSLQWLMERLVGEEEWDTESTRLVCCALCRLPARYRTRDGGLGAEMIELVAVLSDQMTELAELPAIDGGLRGHPSVEVMQRVVSQFYALSCVAGVGDDVVPQEREDGLADVEGGGCSAKYIRALDACATCVGERVVELAEDASPPYGLLTRLLRSPSRVAHRTASEILVELAQQHASLPTTQAFQFLLALGDGGWSMQQVPHGDAATHTHDTVAPPAPLHHQRREVWEYLRGEFAKTATAQIPPVQLCAALRALSMTNDGYWPRGEELLLGHTATPETSSSGGIQTNGAPHQEQEAFLRLCHERILMHVSGDGLEIRLAIALVAALFELGDVDATFMHKMAAYMDAQRSAAPAATTLCADAAHVACLALGEDLLDTFSDLHAWLLEVEEQGVRGQWCNTSPSTWMRGNDPTHHLLPLTPEQEEGWDIVDLMVQTRSDDVDQLRHLAERYLQLLPQLRPDDMKYFFGVCEEKVYKEDTMMKRCLLSMIEAGATQKLSATTLAAILHSLASIRFAYYRVLAQFMLAVTEEQWRRMDAGPLVQILAAMARLGLRTPLVLQHATTRLHQLCPFLRPRDTAEALHALQALGVREEVLLAKLMTHAAASSRVFDEASLSYLFSAPNVHRLLRTADVARPLLERAATVISSPRQREKISLKLKRCTGLPRELIADYHTRFAAVEPSTMEPTKLRLAV